MPMEAKRNKNSCALTKHLTLPGRSHCWRSTSCCVSLWKTGTFNKSQWTIPEFESTSMGRDKENLFLLCLAFSISFNPSTVAKCYFLYLKDQLCFPFLTHLQTYRFVSFIVVFPLLVFPYYTVCIPQVFYNVSLYSSPFTDLLSLTSALFPFQFGCIHSPASRVLTQSAFPRLPRSLVLTEVCIKV